MKTKLSLETLFENFMFASQVEGKSPRTLEQYERVFKQLKVFCPKDPEDITPQDIREYLANLNKKGLKKATVWTHHKVLRVLFNFLAREGYLKRNPMAAIANIRMPKVFPKVLSEEEARKLLAYAARGKGFYGKRNYALISLLLDTGVRLSEVIGLKLEDVSLSSQVLKVFGKGSKERVVPFSRETAKTLFTYLKVRGDIPFEDRFFVGRDGCPLLRYHTYRIVRDMAKRARLRQEIGPHVLRHTFATTWVKAGGDAKRLQHMLGHSDPRTVDIYVNLTARDLREAHLQFSPLKYLFQRQRR